MEFRIEKVDGHKDWRVINGKRRKFTNVISNVYKFNFKGKEYHCIMLGDEYRVFEFKFNSPRYHNPVKSTNYRFFKGLLLHWGTLEEKLKELVDEYKEYESNDKWIPSAPDSTKFNAKVSGHIAYRSNYSKWHYNSIYTNYTHLIEKGSNMELPQEFYDKLFTIYLSHILSGIMIRSENGNLYNPIISWFYGTSWSGIGLAT